MIMSVQLLLLYQKASVVLWKGLSATVVVRWLNKFLCLSSTVRELSGALSSDVHDVIRRLRKHSRALRD